LPGDGAEVATTILLEECDCGAYLARSAVAALKAVMFKEGSLDWMERFAVGKTFDCRNLSALGRGSESEAGVYAAAIEDDGTGTALAVVASLLAAREMEVLAQSVEQCSASVEGEGM